MAHPDLSFLEGKDLSEVMNYADNLLLKNTEDKVLAHFIFNRCLLLISNDYQPDILGVRGTLKRKIWDCERKLGWNERFFSQAGQDKLIKDHFFSNLKGGFFLEIGAYDGVIGSNCFYFEQFMGWDGIAVEASEQQYEKLKANRKCKTLNSVVNGTAEEVEFVEVVDGFMQMSGINSAFYTDTLKILEDDNASKLIKRLVSTVTVDDILKQKQVVDFMSIDVEGGEMDILNSIDFDKYHFRVISVENNRPHDQNFQAFFKKSGFLFFERVGQDEIFYHPDRVSFSRI